MQLQKTNSAKESLSSKLKESEQQNRSLKAELDKLKQDYELEKVRGVYSFFNVLLNYQRVVSILLLVCFSGSK